MEFQVYVDKAGEMRWRLVAGNGETIADSSEGYSHRADLEHAIGLVRNNALTAKLVEKGREKDG